VTTAVNGELCRVTVIGPNRKVDLAVPAATPVATLLPVLLRHTTTMGPAVASDRSAARADADAPGGTWVLQRLGQEPFELTGTPQSLDWLQGEELHLRPAEDPLPELDFDDLADGIATVVKRRADRWQPEYRRYLFLVLSAVALGVLGAVLADQGPVLPQVFGAGVLSLAFGLVAVLAGRRTAGSALSLLFGLASSAFAALAASSAVDGVPDGVALTEASGIASAAAVTVVAALLLLAQRTIAPTIPAAPLLVVAATALSATVVLVLRIALGMSAQLAAATGAAIVFVAIIFVPKAAIKIARLRGPQLPKTGEELTFDIEPAPSDVVRDRTNEADTYLTVAMIAAALVLPVLFHFVMQVPGWAGWTFVTVVSSAVLLRSRTFVGAWQRLALVAAGIVGYVMVVMMFSATASPAGRGALLVGLLILVAPLVLAALRPAPRRLLPIWEHTATGLDVLTGLAILPLLAQILGVFAWARGLFG
jgi:ESX secretion system protein EccD